MNRKTLQKLADAIERGDKAYAMGMLDMIMDTLPEEHAGILGKVTLPPVHSTEEKDEAKALEYMAKAKMESVKLMAGEIQ